MVARSMTTAPKQVLDILKHYRAPACVHIPVHWGEMDAFGHLNNVVYLRYFETGRIAFFNHINSKRISEEFGKRFMDGKHIGPIIKTVSCKYKSPVFFPDTLLIAVKVPFDTIKLDRFEQHFIAISYQKQIVVAEGKAEVVMFDYSNNCKALIPDLFRKALEDEEVELSAKTSL